MIGHIELFSAQDRPTTSPRLLWGCVPVAPYDPYVPAGDSLGLLDYLDGKTLDIVRRVVAMQEAEIRRMLRLWVSELEPEVVYRDGVMIGLAQQGLSQVDEPTIAARPIGFHQIEPTIWGTRSDWFPYRLQSGDKA